MSQPDDATDHQEHLRLAGVVKGVHAELRKKYKTDQDSLKKIWEDHCQNTPILTEYADAMHHLAVDHWAKKTGTRIDWCRDIAREYFHEGGLKKTLDKEERKAWHEEQRCLAACGHGDEQAEHQEEGACGDSAIGGVNLPDIATLLNSYNSVMLPLAGKMRLLDVGSCFNPFLDFEEFLAVGIDISPAKRSVYHCDFLHLQTTDPLQVAPDTLDTYLRNLKNPIETLPKECFHIVVFSLLLEYFPAPYQRWISCQKAWELLRYNGILIIVTPDSHQQHRNAPMMKSWKRGIESMGFMRWRYEKQEHLHCMVFRKVEKEVKLDNLISDITPDMLYIPQDFHDIGGLCLDIETSSFSAENEIFYMSVSANELPVLNSDTED